MGVPEPQNVNESTAPWRAATGKGYEDLLDASDMAALAVYFQQRHLLAHREGMVDQDYFNKISDPLYKVEHKLIIKEEVVLGLADLIERLASGLHIGN